MFVRAMTCRAMPRQRLRRYYIVEDAATRAHERCYDDAIRGIVVTASERRYDDAAAMV